MVFVFPPPAFGAKPAMGNISEFGFRIDFGPALTYGLFQAIDVFACIAMEALDVNEGKAKRGGTACGPQSASKSV